MFDVAEQDGENFAGILTLATNSTATQNLWIRATLTESNVNGVTRKRLEVEFLNSNESVFNLNTTNIGTDKQVELSFFGFMQ